MENNEPEKKSPYQNEKNEIPAHAGDARKLERELGLGVKEDSSPRPGMPAAQGGGLTSEVGSSPKIVAPDQ